MDYRDERDALRGRVDNLEQELGDARRELDAQRGDDRQARIAQIEAQMADAQRLLGHLGSELAELKGPPPARRGAAPASAVAALVALAVAAGVMGFLVMRRPAVVPPPVLQVPEPVQPAPPPPAPWRKGLLEDGTLACPLPPADLDALEERSGTRWAFGDATRAPMPASG